MRRHLSSLTLAILAGALSACAVRAQAGNALPDAPLTVAERMLVELPANSWYKAPHTKMSGVCAADSFHVHGVLGCTAVVGAWSGGAWDADQRKMLVWGGGHDDYWGNEVYAFDVPTMKWQRLTDPSPPPFSRDPLADGNPVSRHTYGGLQYLTRSRRLFAVGGARARDGGGTRVTWLFDAAAGKWTEAQAAGDAPGGYSMSSAYDAASNSVILRDQVRLYDYDVERNAWSVLAQLGNLQWPRYEIWGDKSGVIDTRRRLFWSIGGGDYLVWDLRLKMMVTDSWATKGGGSFEIAPKDGGPGFSSGGQEIRAAQAPGVDYDSKADQLVAWKGGAPWALDLGTRTWSRRGGAGAPSLPQRTGTYGRWRYLPRYNVFILINDVNDDVYFFKNTAGGP